MYPCRRSPGQHGPQRGTAMDGQGLRPNVPPHEGAASPAATTHVGILPCVARGRCRHAVSGPFWQFDSQVVFFVN
jgi:hypothetical protein